MQTCDKERSSDPRGPWTGRIAGESGKEGFLGGFGEGGCGRGCVKLRKKIAGGGSVRGVELGNGWLMLDCSRYGIMQLQDTLFYSFTPSQSWSRSLKSVGRDVWYIWGVDDGDLARAQRLTAFERNQISRHTFSRSSGSFCQPELEAVAQSTTLNPSDPCTRPIEYVGALVEHSRQSTSPGDNADSKVHMSHTTNLIDPRSNDIEVGVALVCTELGLGAVELQHQVRRTVDE